MEHEEIVQPETVDIPEQPIVEVEDGIDADELEALRQQAAELAELQTKLAADKQRAEILDHASQANVKGIEQIYDFLDLSKIDSDEGKAALFAAFSQPTVPKRVPIGQPTNGGPQRDRSADAILAEAAAKARASGRDDDMVAYARLKRELKK